MREILSSLTGTMSSRFIPEPLFSVTSFAAFCGRSGGVLGRAVKESKMLKMWFVACLLSIFLKDSKVLSSQNVSVQEGLHPEPVQPVSPPASMASRNDILLQAIEVVQGKGIFNYPTVGIRAEERADGTLVVKFYGAEKTGCSPNLTIPLCQVTVSPQETPPYLQMHYVPSSQSARSLVLKGKTHVDPHKDETAMLICSYLAKRGRSLSSFRLSIFDRSTATMSTGEKYWVMVAPLQPSLDNFKLYRVSNSGKVTQ